MQLRFFLSAFLSIAVSSQCLAQQIDFSIKAGAAKLLGPPNSAREGYAYVTAAPPSPYPALYIEANKRNVFKRINVVAGIGMLPTFSHISINPKNIKNGYGSVYGFVIYALQLHLGVERLFGKNDSRINKNYFSIIGAIGFNPNGKLKDTFELSDGGYTQNNEVFQGSTLSFQHTPFFAPILIGGSRYHIRNRKGTEVLGMDLLLVYNLSQYYDHTFTYTINNVPASELIPEKGFSIQLLFVKRLFWIKR